MWQTCQSQDQNPQNALERPSRCFLKGKDIVVASSSVFNIGVELKGTLDVYPRLSIHKNTDILILRPEQLLLFCPIFIPIILKLFLFHPFPTRVAQFLHYVMQLWMVLLPFCWKLDAILPFHWQRPVKHRGFPVKGWNPKRFWQSWFITVIGFSGCFDFTVDAELYMLDLEFIHLPHSRCVDLWPAGGQKDGPNGAVAAVWNAGKLQRTSASVPPRPGAKCPVASTGGEWGMWHVVMAPKFWAPRSKVQEFDRICTACFAYPNLGSTRLRLEGE